ncbi:MAG TPA: hypothetical protein VFK88_14170 [Gallionella sp.]|nr:hypothetical protein [Gallionella sp.]
MSKFIQVEPRFGFDCARAFRPNAGRLFVTPHGRRNTSALHQSAVLCCSLELF